MTYQVFEIAADAILLKFVGHIPMGVVVR